MDHVRVIWNYFQLTPGSVPFLTILIQTCNTRFIVKRWGIWYRSGHKCFFRRVSPVLSSVINRPSINFIVQHKGEFHRITYHEKPEVEYRYSSTLSLTSALDGVGWTKPRPCLFTPLERPDTHCIGGWVGPRAGLDGPGKSRPPQGFDPRTVQPVASRYTD